VNQPQLADVMPLPVHPTRTHPITGAPLQAVGFRRNGDPLWPVMGGSQPFGGPAPGTVQPQGGQQGGPQPVPQFVQGLGGQPVPVLAPGAMPFAPQPQAGPPQQGGYPATFVQPGGQPPVQQPYGQPGAMPQAPWMPAPQQQPQQGVPFAYPGFGQLPHPGQTAGQPGQPGTAPANGQPPAAGQPGQQPAGQPQGGGQQTGNDGPWDKPYPQKPLAEMTVEEQNAYWKYHNRKLEGRLQQYADYDQVKAQLAQLQQMTQTEWQRAVLDAENRGRSSAMEQAAGQMVAVAFQGAANNRMTPDQIQAQLGVLDPKRFVHNGQVDIAAIHALVDTIAPARQNGLVPLLPQQQQGQLPLQQVTLGGYMPTAQPGQPGYGQPLQPGQPGYGQPLQPGQPGYAQQPTFGPAGGQPQPGAGQWGALQQQVPPIGQGWGAPAQQQQYGQPQQYGQAPGQYGGQPGYGQIPVPGVPTPYQAAGQVVPPVVQAAGVHGLPGLGQGRGGLPAAADFGQGPAFTAPASPAQAGSAMAAARHGKTRSAQIAETRG
jgi:hypothetical protein